MERYTKKLCVFAGICFFVGILLFVADYILPPIAETKSGLGVLQIVGAIAVILGVSAMSNIATCLYLAHRKKPVCEGAMIGRLYWILGTICVGVVILYGLGILGKAGTLFTLFGGMLLGWSLQGPVSGFAAWLLISAKRPFRPGDRVQFPKLELTGDIKDIGTMYLQLNQVGGSIASEEAVGRNILIPNAMLFDQVVINYTAAREAPYMLDEVVIGITYDSNWDIAEKILLAAAYKVTKETIETTNVQPYIRSELYDYGVYLQLRYQVRVEERAKVAYRITKFIFDEIQRTPSVDIPIPYIYSYRAGHKGKNQQPFVRDRFSQDIKEIEMSSIHDNGYDNRNDIKQLASSINADGLTRPIVLKENPKNGDYDILAGHSRFEACKNLGWKTIPALIVKVPENRDCEVQT
ncbi:MAG: mechanosensitive ion channel [Phycisphaerae bacterium]|nr:mechanosensitive ion channel [Phycisphaerae bacterium]